ncbi:MAG: hypothetical protein J7L89_05830, partial [Bacteroidales bacterium]|nr:hypothetical protein [Bacteroidales bacterium]
YPPYKILITLVLIALPVTGYFLLVPGTQHKTGWLNQTGVSPALINAVPAMAGGTRKGPDLPVAADTEFVKKNSVDFTPPRQPIEFFGDTAVLEPFFQQLYHYSQGLGQIRILHYGDSQLEEDRITRYLRARLQAQFPAQEDQTQIQVENIPKRGSAGIDLVPDHGPPPSLIIMQFGINVVRARTRDFSYYTRALIKQIHRFMAVNPHVSILLVGVSDMAHREANTIYSYATVPLIRDAQVEAARKIPVAFWDLYKMMGGNGSAARWYLTDPPLIREDLTHFSFAGGEEIANQLFDALMWAYHRWIIKFNSNLNEPDI